MTILFIFFASFVCAVLERLNTKHFYRSVFRNLNPQFWSKKHSVNYCKSIYGYPLDACFYLQVTKIIFIILAIVFYKPVTVPVVDFFLFCGVWAFNYDITYKGVLRDKI